MFGLLWLIAASIIAGVLVIRVFGEIDRYKIKGVVSTQGKVKDKSLHAKVKEVQPDAVTFGMYDMNGNHIQDVKMKSISDYVNSEIRVGDKIY